jgi:selenide, water dikinase
MIDTDRRKRVMQRSIRLGHCICNPKQPCPCEQFKVQNICACAGERLDSPSGDVRLTQLVEKPGCASKIDQVFLKEVLQGLPSIDDPRILVGVPAGDDAGVYDLGDGQALVQTVDVFTPSVDDPYLFGQVAAANSVSDIYAMGGKPITALSVIGFPMRKIPDSAMKDILRGGIDKMNEAGVAIIGGHSINDDQIKAGFAVTGLIDKTRIVTNAGAKPGDVLILTKPLGTGIVAFAGQIGKATREHLQAAGQSMAELNRTASELMLQFGAHACTDVTGFSLMGHLAEMARASSVDVELVWDDIPLLPGVLEYAAAGILPGAIERNKESCSRRVNADVSLPVEMADICYDAQTSGGLLIVVSKRIANDLLKALHDAGMARAAIIGRAVDKGSGRISLHTTGGRPVPHVDLTNKSEAAYRTDAVGSHQNLDAYTRQAIAIALSVALQNESCLKTHLINARKKGFTQEEIDEAASVGVSFAGAPAMVFYERLAKRAT